MHHRSHPDRGSRLTRYKTGVNRAPHPYREGTAAGSGGGAFERDLVGVRGGGRFLPMQHCQLHAALTACAREVLSSAASAHIHLGGKSAQFLTSSVPEDVKFMPFC